MHFIACLILRNCIWSLMFFVNSVLENWAVLTAENRKFTAFHTHLTLKIEGIHRLEVCWELSF